jgi:RNA polymerase sigma-70 factor (ECF subfamily)
MTGTHLEQSQLSDGELLDHFVASRNSAAFEELVQRHAALVLNVCRRILQSDFDADDAFQDTFMVLLRKARTLDKRGPLANWLYAVAYRVSLKTKVKIMRRRRDHTDALEGEFSSQAESIWKDLGPVLDEEINLLPAKYRLPLVLCYLRGRTQQEAAHDLGWPKGSMSRRMNRARALLRKRLAKRGIALSVILLIFLLGEKASAATASRELIEATTKAALAFGSKHFVWGSLSANGVASSAPPASNGWAVTGKGSVRRKVIAGILLALLALILAGWFSQNGFAFTWNGLFGSPQQSCH